MTALREVVAAADPALGAYAVDDPPAGELEAAVGAGPRAIVVEAIREGYLLHYAEPRLIADADPDLRLLAGDYLFALGLERLAGLGDTAAVSELSDLISLSAQLHAELRPPESLGALWLAAGTALACGSGPAHEAAKRELRAGDAAATTSLASAAAASAAEAGIDVTLAAAADSIDFPLDLHS